MGKKVFYDEDARRRVLAGAEIVYRAVKTTMGPKGRNVIIGKNYGPGVVTHDGITVARSIELSESEENLGYKTGADLIIAASSKVNDIAGDGTTTVVVLTYHLLNEANKLIAAGHDPMLLRKGLEEAVKDVLLALRANSEAITESSPKVAEIATISAADKEIGKLIAEVIDKVGKDGVVTVEEGQGLELESEVVKGYTFDKGFVSPYLVTDQSRMEAVLNQPLVLITDMKLNNMQALLPLIEKIAQAGKKELFIIADDIEGEVLQTLVLNKIKGTFNTIAVKAPSFGDHRKEILNDLATLTGATVITEDQGFNLQTAELSFLGQCKKVITTQTETTIIEGVGASEDVEARIKAINKTRANATSNYDKERYSERAAALGGKVAVIKIGGVTETEIEEKKFRVDDAVAAVKAALAEGIVPGGGVMLLRLAGAVRGEDAGSNLLRTALGKPFEILLKNSGFHPATYENQIYESKDGNDGVDVRTGQFVNLKEAGIVDPTKVTKEALQNAVSIAATTITMGALIVEEPAKEQPQQPQMPMRP